MFVLVYDQPELRLGSSIGDLARDGLGLFFGYRKAGRPGRPRSNLLRLLRVAPFRHGARDLSTYARDTASAKGGRCNPITNAVGRSRLVSAEESSGRLWRLKTAANVDQPADRAEGSHVLLGPA